MRSRVGLVVVVLLVAILAAVSIGTSAYQAGMVRGLAEAGKLPPPVAGVPYGYYPLWYHGPFGFGLGGLLFPLLFLFLVFRLFRRPYWGRSCAGGGRGDSGLPPAFEEWHRRAHESMEARGERV